MSHSIQNTKSILAKALAQEDIRVEHSPVATTASFDVANRLLTLPVWENVSDEMYDLLVGHEVGHALYTPDHDKQINKIDNNRGPWIYEAERIGGNVNASYVQGILNIIEDVRIERKVKDKYPGLRRDFAIGYQQMLDRDFFGTQGKDLSELAFPDRINLYFKVGVYLNVPFTDDEMKIVDEISNCQSFDDTIRLAENVYAFMNGKQMNIQMPELKMDVSMDLNPGDNNDEKSDMTSPVTVVPSNEDKNQTGNARSSGNSSDDGKNQEKKISQELSNSPRGGSGLVQEKILPKMITQDAFDKKNTENVSKSLYCVQYNTLPEANSSEIIYPHSKVNARIEERIADISKNPSGALAVTKIRAKYNKLINDVRPLIGSLIQQFEMKKAADIQKRTSVSRSGKIDADRIFKYKVSDDIFARYATIAEGKNHGMVMFVDWSASMQGCTEDVLTQIVMLAQFCRRMGIPFEVYLFSSQYSIHFDTQNNKDPISSRYDDGYRMLRDKQWRKKGHFRALNRSGGNSDSPTEPEIFALNQILSSSMTAKQFNDALFNTFFLGQVISHPADVFSECKISVYPPTHLGQGNTPLDSTILAAMDIVPNFQKKHKVQIVNTIFLTDGESGWSPYHLNGGYYAEKVYAISPINKKQYDVSQFMTATDSLLHIFSDITGSTVIGFHLLPLTTRSSHCRYLAPDSETGGYATNKESFKSFRENGFYDAPKKKICFVRGDDYKQIKKEFYNHGYDRMFLLPTKSEDIESVENVLNGIDSSASFLRVRNAFFKASEKRAASRGFINRFADVISVPTKR